MSVKQLKKYIPEDIICEVRHWQNYSEFKALRNKSGEFSLKGFDQHKCIFIHIPKTAGISISKALFGNRSGGHKSTRFYKQIFGVFIFNSYFKFSFVRNPYSRLVSAYNFLMKGGFCKKHKKWVEENISNYESFHDFVTMWLNEENINNISHFRPQFNYVCDKNDKVEIDFIGRFENLEEDFQKVCRILDIDTELPHINSSNTTQHWKTFYNNETLKIVERVYKKDFDIFGYDKISK